ncbi:MAG: hypothetical protein EX271_00590 [Acidimicrobiales bacterium]|nr:PepSY domain-containing protein [Hyphomonadaceae bacterium]RZV44905.1 MAG: hypothetical protein EX271_00590 [Acidimicrobiales bacterium]
MMQTIRHIYLGATATILALTAGSAMAAESGKVLKIQSNYENVLPVAVEDRVMIKKFAQRSGDRQISASQAKSAALRSRPGSKFVNIQMSGNGTYRVRLQQKNGRIVDVYVDARTGRVKN